MKECKEFEDVILIQAKAQLYLDVIIRHVMCFCAEVAEVINVVNVVKVIEVEKIVDVVEIVEVVEVV